jgi:hypothetical protein
MLVAQENFFYFDFLSLDYLLKGNKKQKRVYELLTSTQLFETLRDFHPVFVGTIPIQIDIESSDIDVLIEAEPTQFLEFAKQHLTQHQQATFFVKDFQHIPACVYQFKLEEFEVEIFAQDLPVTQQYAYRHLIIENKILLTKGEAFRDEIIRLKRQGLKTEPAFAQALGLSGNPYESLLHYPV